MTTDELAQEVARLRRRVDELERTGGAGLLDGQPYLPETMLLSDSFLKRAFAVLGHYFVGSLVIFGPLYLLIFIAAVSFG